MDDAQIIALYFARDEQAIVETGNRYGAYCKTIAGNILENAEDAEECVNDSYHSAWAHIPPDKPGCLRAYLGRIVRNAAISRYRTNRAQKRYCGAELLLSELGECIPAAEQPQAVLERRELAQHISAWLRSLPQEDCTLFLRRYWYGEQVKTLANWLGGTPNRTAQRLFALRGALRRYLEEREVAI